MSIIEIQVGGAITVLNGIALGKGAAMGTSEVHTISIQPADQLIYQTKDDIDTDLLEACVEEFMQFTGQSIDNIMISTDIAYPPAKGMKTSSAVSCGVFDALSKYYDVPLKAKTVIDLSATASINAGVSITGAIDDAYATYTGGFHITDNLSRAHLASHSLQLDHEIIFIIPDDSNIKSDISTDFDLLDEYILEKAFKAALRGDWRNAIMRNSRVYGQYYLDDLEIINQIEDQISGTIGLNGAGPSLFLICKPDYRDYNLNNLHQEFPQYNYEVTQLRF